MIYLNQWLNCPRGAMEGNLILDFADEKVIKTMQITAEINPRVLLDNITNKVIVVHVGVNLTHCVFGHEILP